MIKASTLYIVVIVSLLIAIISTSLLAVAFYYRLEVQKKTRLDKLLINTESGISILQSKGFTKYNENQLIDLFGDQQDSLVLRKEQWGVFELGTVKAFELKDTIKRSFFIGNVFTDQNAIYLADEDRPLSLSGKTQITGNGELPKSGLKQAYVDGKPYAGKELINGKIGESTRDVPPVNEKVIDSIIQQMKVVAGLTLDSKDSTGNSFFNPVQIYKLDAGSMNIGARKFKGKIILVSDTTIMIDGNTELENVQVYAPAIMVADGFKGSCQLFARDSVIIGKNCEFAYPSFVGVFKPEDGKVQSKISIAEGGRFSGLLFSYEKKRTELQTIISIAKNCKVNGQIFATGYIKLDKGVIVNGKVYAKRFIMQTPTSLYENYLIDITLNRKLLSKYYLGTFLLKNDLEEQKILKWLE